MKTAGEIKEYYDEFAKSTFLRDFRILNPRLRAIGKLCDRFIAPGARVLEIGCGAGIISKHLETRVSRLVGIDISETAIRMAKLHVTGDRCEFRVLDVTGDASDLNRYEKFDAILMPDVLEHIPKARQRDLFSRIENLLGPRGVVLITYPSPEYQEYLRRHRPELLQVVDETLRLSEILAITSLRPGYFAYVDAGEKNQYVHLVLKLATDYSPESPPIGFSGRVVRRARKILWRLRNEAFLRKVKNVF
ncbi:MAG: class I SAM-dependent methyltransferase [Candidatus Krumholzibacteriia bacterium]